jgi:hypothetical protein
MLPEGIDAARSGGDAAELTAAFHRGFLLTGCVAALAAFAASRIPHIELWPARIRGPGAS